MPDMKRYYEDYWRRKEEEGRLYTQGDAWVPERIKLAVSMITREVGPLSCIDVGCGEGTVGKLLREALGKDVYLVACDISETALKRASSYYDELLQIDFDSDDEPWKILRGRRFDKVFCLETLEHLFKPQKLLSSFKEILKDDAEIIVSFPNVAWYGHRIELLRGRHPEFPLENPGDHIQNFTLDSFRELLATAGFVPVGMDAQFKFPTFCRPRRVFYPLFGKFPRLFGTRIVIKGRMKT